MWTNLTLKPKQSTCHNASIDLYLPYPLTKPISKILIKHFKHLSKLPLSSINPVANQLISEGLLKPVLVRVKLEDVEYIGGGAGLGYQGFADLLAILAEKAAETTVCCALDQGVLKEGVAC
jgi:hypothetical protein